MTRRASGFTLLEVLVALVIVAFGMGAVLSALTSAANNTSALHEKTLAEWIGLNQIATVRVALNQPADGDTEGDLQYAGGKWHWQQTVDDLEIPGIRRITVQVRRVLDSEAANARQTNWLATVVGFRGDAISAANGQMPNWQGAVGSTSSSSSGSSSGSSSSSGIGVHNPSFDPGSSSGASGNSAGGSGGG